MLVTMFLRPQIGTLYFGTDARLLSGQNIRNNLVLAPDDFIPQRQFSLLQPRHLHRVRDSRFGQCGNRIIQISVFDFQQLGALCPFIHIHS
jgi:hypothetical protein